MTIILNAKLETVKNCTSPYSSSKSMKFTTLTTLALHQLIPSKTPTGTLAFSPDANHFFTMPKHGFIRKTDKIQYPTFSMASQLDETTDASAPLYTKADVTEAIRHESILEMGKVVNFFNTLTSSSIRVKPTLLKDQDQVSAHLNKTLNIQNYLFDCDGVLYRGADPMPEVSESIQSLMNNGKKVFFVTNNAGSSRSELKRKLEKVLHCPDGMLSEEMMIGSAYVAAKYLQSRLMGNKDVGNDKTSPRVHVIGTAGLCHEIQSAGFNVSGGPDPEGTSPGMSREDLAAYSFPEVEGKLSESGKIHAVVIGLDNDFNYRKLCIATVLLQHNPQAILVATNLDAFDLVGSDARHLPGNGALVRAVEAASGRDAINVGKPSRLLAQLILEKFNLKAEETIMIGDRLDTDIKFGNDGGMKTGLVLTGCANEASIENAVIVGDQSAIPTLIFPHVGMIK
ncbi:hypothetical protein ACHAXS_008439 [Conticribra weissflogii]